MEKLKKFCNACKEEKDIVEIEKYSQGEVIRLSCGHKIAWDIFTDIVTVTDEIMAKHFDPSHNLKSRYKTKTSGESKRPARDNIIIDRKRRKIIHKIWEQDNDGEWKLVHDEEKPLPEK